MKLKISQIKVKERERELIEVDSLVKSIKQNGLIHPILIDSKFNLLVGSRRLSALILLGIVELNEGEHFRIQKEELSILDRLSLELDENTEREDFSYQEEINLREKIHLIGVELALAKGEDWSRKKSAELLGISEVQLGRDLKVADGIRKDPELAKEKDKNVILSRIKKKEETDRRLMLARISSGDEIKAKIIHGDALEEMKKLSDHSIDLMLVDPPFGVALSDRSKGDWTKKYGKIYGGFKDSKEESLNILKGVLIEAKRILKIGHYCWVFYSTKNGIEVEQIIRETLGGYQPVPGIWKKSSNFNWKPFEYQCVNYEPYFMCWNFSKQRSLQKAINCVNDFPGVQNKIHPAEKPLELYDFLIEASSVENEMILDPFLGSGASAESAIKLNRNFIGIESSSKMVDLINLRLKKGEI